MVLTNFTELEALVKKHKDGESVKLPSATTASVLPEQYNRILSCMGRYFSKDISLRRDPSGKGVMTVRFSSDDEMAGFLQALENSL